MDSAPSSTQDDGLDFIRRRTPISSSGPRPIPSDWRPPPPSNIQKSQKRSIGKRISRAFARFTIVFLLGIGATLGWQSYGDEAMEMARTPRLASLLPVSKAKPSPDDQGSTTAAAISPQLERFELSLLVVRRSVEQLALMVEQLSAKQDQLAAKQDQLSHIATLKSVESPPQSRTPPRKPPQPAGQ